MGEGRLRAAQLVSNLEKLRFSLIVNPYVLDENSQYVANVDLFRSHHLFDIGPIFPAVEKSFKHSEVVTTQEGELTVGDRVACCADNEIVMEAYGEVIFRALRGRLKSFWAPSGASNWTFEESYER
jgi:hypothetical protein